MSAHGEVYSAPRLYDLAFSYRDYDREARFLLELYRARRGHDPRRFLELGAGPARHAIAMAKAGLSAVALDLSPEMARYGLDEAKKSGVELEYLTADMIRFELGAPVDLAATMLCSATYILEDEDFVLHLRAVAAALTPGGLYVIELPHPTELDGRPKTKSTWTMSDPTGKLDVEWLDGEGSSAAAARQAPTIARLHFQPQHGEPILIESQAPLRAFSRGEIEDFVARSGRFEVISVFGALDPLVSLEAEKAWRMVVTLARR